MKLKPVQAGILEIAKATKKAPYPQLIANGGNGKTVGALVEKGLLTENPATAKAPKTYTITAAGKDALKAHAKSLKPVGAR